MPGVHTFYDGSKLLEPLADKVGFEVDKVNLVVCQLVSIVFSWFYYYHLPPSRTSRTVRLAFPGVIGLALCYFCYGSAIKHIVANVAICYALMKIAPDKYVHKLVFVFSIGYLIFIHWFRWYVLTIYSIDVTGAIMVIVQKTTTLAFSLHDGRVKRKDELTELQKREAVKEFPTMLDYFSYMFTFQTVMTGPLCFYADYQRFIAGDNFVVDGQRHTPSPLRPALRKMATSLFFLLVLVRFSEGYPPEAIIEPAAMRMGWPSWLALFYVTIVLRRVQYYFAWGLADAICNLSGFGFNGFTPDGEEKWDLLTNAYPLKVELAFSFKETLDGWNCTTMYWLRRVAYERVPAGYRTLSTYLLSAIWHGFFIGYYVTFLTAALVTLAARTVRRCVRHRFQGTEALRRLYDAITFLATKFALMYTTFPFVMLHLGPGLYLYSRLYFFFHILCAAAIFVLPRVLPPPRRSSIVGAAKTGVELIQTHEKKCD